MSILIILSKKVIELKSFNYFGVIVSLLFFFISILNVEINNSQNRQNYFFKKGVHYYQVRINEPPEVKNKSVKILVDCFSRNDLKVSGKVLIYVKKDERALNLSYGDVLLINTEFNKTKSNGNPFEFNYSNYLNLFDIHHQGFLNSGEWLKIGDSQINCLNLLIKLVDT